VVEIVVSEKFRLFDLMLRCASDGDARPTHKGLHPGQERIFGSFPCPRLGADRMTGGLMLLAMLLIELKGGWSELCNGDWAGNVGVDMGRPLDAWIRRAETMGSTHQNVGTQRVCACNGEGVLGGPPCMNTILPRSTCQLCL